jgi:hypothetical protein
MLDLPPHMGSPTARRSTMGVGVAVDSKPSDVIRAVVASFMLLGHESWVMYVRAKRWSSNRGTSFMGVACL